MPRQAAFAFNPPLVSSEVLAMTLCRPKHATDNECPASPAINQSPARITMQSRSRHRDPESLKVYRDFWGRQKVRALKALDLEIRRGRDLRPAGPQRLRARPPRSSCSWDCCFPPAARPWSSAETPPTSTKNERIGYLPEESYLYRFLNAEETLDFYGRLFDMPAPVRRQRDGRPDRHGRAELGQAPAAEGVLQGHDAPHRPGPGPDQRSGADPARRADQRPGPDRHAGDEGPDPQAQATRARRC